jgi:hypothetical protein
MPSVTRYLDEVIRPETSMWSSLVCVFYYVPVVPVMLLLLWLRVNKMSSLYCFCVYLLNDKRSRCESTVTTRIDCSEIQNRKHSLVHNFLVSLGVLGGSKIYDLIESFSPSIEPGCLC